MIRFVLLEYGILKIEICFGTNMFIYLLTASSQFTKGTINIKYIDKDNKQLINNE